MSLIEMLILTLSQIQQPHLNRLLSISFCWAPPLREPGLLHFAFSPQSTFSSFHFVRMPHDKLIKLSYISFQLRFKHLFFKVTSFSLIPVVCIISALESKVRVNLENKVILRLALIPGPGLSQGVRAGCIHLSVSVGPSLTWIFLLFFCCFGFFLGGGGEKREKEEEGNKKTHKNITFI